ncbi:MAG: hypothetical protein WA733_18280, partial [Methylocystis sp.]
QAIPTTPIPTTRTFGPASYPPRPVAAFAATKAPAHIHFQPLTSGFSTPRRPMPASVSMEPLATPWDCRSAIVGGAMVMRRRGYLELPISVYRNVGGRTGGPFFRMPPMIGAGQKVSAEGSASPALEIKHH